MNHLRIMRSGTRGVLFDPITGRISVLNEVGILILEGLQSGLAKSELKTQIVERYGASEEAAERDLIDFMGQLTRSKILGGE